MKVKAMNETRIARILFTSLGKKVSFISKKLSNPENNPQTL
jgi:hypothetical protein